MSRVTCPSCQVVIKTRIEDAGKTGKCPKCGAALILPSAAPAAGPIAVPVGERGAPTGTSFQARLSRTLAADLPYRIEFSRGALYFLCLGGPAGRKGAPEPAPSGQSPETLLASHAESFKLVPAQIKRIVFLPKRGGLVGLHAHVGRLSLETADGKEREFHFEQLANLATAYDYLPYWLPHRIETEIAWNEAGGQFDTVPRRMADRPAGTYPISVSVAAAAAAKPAPTRRRVFTLRHFLQMVFVAMLVYGAVHGFRGNVKPGGYVQILDFAALGAGVVGSVLALVWPGKTRWW
jgi:hypothetical protein